MPDHEPAAAPVLIVVAHPDDEVLGCGGTAAVLASHGHAVRACILSGEVNARHQRPGDDALSSDIEASRRLLGLQEPILGSFPNIKMNTVPHLDLVQFVETAISQTGATCLMTHHPGDLNDDHRQVSLATQAAARLFQRRSDAPRLRSLHYMEIPSSTDWSFPGNHTFQADSFFQIGRDGVEAKLEALAAYRDVMRPYPHPRSREAIEGLAAYRGGQAGAAWAEAFQTAFVDVGQLFS